MDIEAKIEKHDNEIQLVGRAVDKLAVMFDASEKRRDTDMNMVKDAVRSIQDLNNQMNKTLGIEKDVATCRELMAEQKGEVGKLRHDLANVLNAMQALPKLNEKIADVAKDGAEKRTLMQKDFAEKFNEVTQQLAAHGTAIKNIETWRSELHGAGTALKNVGAVLWTIIGAIASFIATLVYNHYSGGGGGGMVSGE